MENGHRPGEIQDHPQVVATFQRTAKEEPIYIEWYNCICAQNLKEMSKHYKSVFLVLYLYNSLYLSDTLFCYEPTGHNPEARKRFHEHGENYRLLYAVDCTIVGMVGERCLWSTPISCRRMPDFVSLTLVHGVVPRICFRNASCSFVPAVRSCILPGIGDIGCTALRMDIRLARCFPESWPPLLRRLLEHHLC